MSRLSPRPLVLRSAALVLMLILSGLPSHRTARAGIFRNGAVGGVSIDANGVLKQANDQEGRALRQEIEQRVAQVPAEMDQGLGLRRISLRQLEATLQQADRRELDQLPDELKFLGGLQRVQYVLVYPEEQDLVLVGPAEGWRVTADGHAVGKTTGRPVLQLEDLLVAFQAIFASPNPISCSIDPTEEGIQALRAYLKKQKRFSPEVLPGMEQMLGPQQITVSGVAETSHFARVLVAADYRMKRIAMRFEESPVEELPSFLDMLANSRLRLTNMMPRWWLACDYEPLARSEDGLAWELRGNGVRVHTEDDLVADDGSVTVTGKQNPLAAEWADRMTRNYEQLSREVPVFAQLRNLMDLSVVAALIKREQLIERAGCPLPSFTGKNQTVLLQTWHAPKTVATECSFIKRGRDYLITASGGVQIDAERYAAASQVMRHVEQLKEQSPRPTDRWWW